MHARMSVCACVCVATYLQQYKLLLSMCSDTCSQFRKPKATLRTFGAEPFSGRSP